MLGLAVQRGSLQHMLEWIEMALNSSGRNDGRNLYVSKRVVIASLAAIRRVTIQEIESTWVTSEGSNNQLDLYSAAVILMNEV